MAFSDQRHFLSIFFIITAILLSCVSWDHLISNLQEVVPLNHDHDHHLLVEETSDESYDDHFQAYPSNFNLFEDGKFKGLIRKKTDILTLQEKVGKTHIGSVKKVNVNKHGAKGDGYHDDTEAFEKAWKEACSSKERAVLVVPEGYNCLLKPIRFEGPCESQITVQILGSLEASDDPSDYDEDRKHWLRFDGVENLIVYGGGTINGNGKTWWKNSCKIKKDLPCKGAPTAITFYECKNLVVKDLKIQDAQKIHTSFEKCVNVQAYNLTVTAPEKSPNTDGIHITNTQNMQIFKCVIGTGDDCISIVSGSKNVQVEDVTCGPGHGISIGSLGAKNSEAYVSGVTVIRAKLNGTTNGVRIKTWQGGSGLASNITFADIEMNDVYNPIIINQNYCDQDKPCKKQKKAVQVKNVLYKNITGTSASSVAIKFDCSKTAPCQGIVLQDIDLKGEGKEEEEDETKAECNNVDVQNIGTVSPQCP